MPILQGHISQIDVDIIAPSRTSFIAPEYIANMSLVRAFTTRRNKPEMQISPPMFISRAMSQRGGRPVDRKLISSPVALVSTSNALLNNAQDIAGASPIEFCSVSSGSSTTSASDEDSDASTGSIHSHETVTDASSFEGSSPISSEAEPNHLSCYFKPAVDTQTKSQSRSPSVSARPSFDTPRIPQRVPSHSKKAHEKVHRTRSIQRMMSPPPSRGGETRTSMEFFSPKNSAFVEAPRENPFGNELQQLDEVAEEFGQVVKSVEADADVVFMEAHGLAQFSASDYMSEIQSMIYQTFSDEATAVQDLAGWI